MEGISYVLVLFLAVAVSTYVSASLCAHGPGYWCSSPAAAMHCGAVDFCRQLSERSNSGPPAVAAAAASRRGAIKDDMCPTCQQVLATIKQAQLENKTRAQIEQLIKTQVCQQLGPLEDACNTMVQYFMPQVLQTISMGIQSKLICSLLGMCNQTSDRVPALSAQSQKSHRETDLRLRSPPPFERRPVLMLMRLQQLPRSDKPLSRLASCGLCRALVDGGRRLPLNDDGDVGEARTGAQTLMRTACQLEATPAQRGECLKAMFTHAEVILELITSDLESTIVCQALGACSTSSSSTSLSDAESEAAALLASEIGAVVAGPQCFLCSMVLSRTLRNPGPIKSLIAIQQALKTTCSTLRLVFKTTCGRFVDQYSRMIAELIIKGRGAKFICATLSLCSAGNDGARMMDQNWMPPLPPPPQQQQQRDDDNYRRMQAVGSGGRDGGVDLI